MSQYGQGYASSGGYGSNPYQQNTYGEGGRGYDGGGRAAPPYPDGPGGGGGSRLPARGRYNEPDVEMQPYDTPLESDRYGDIGGGLPTGPRPVGRGGAFPSRLEPAGMGAGGGASGYQSSDEGLIGGRNERMGDSDPNDVLNTCQAIDRTIDELQDRLHALQGLHSRVLNDRATNSEVDRTNNEIMGAYRALGTRLKKVKSNPDSRSPRNAPQVGRVDRRLKKAINDYQKVESDFRRQMQEQQARQYRIVRPEATEEEVREAVEDPNVQVFQQALLTSDRRGQAQSTLNAVRQRHNEIQRIEQTIIELAQLFQDLDQIVLEQEPLVLNIEQKGEEIQDNMVKANVELGHGVKSARGARKKKWICFWIVVVLIVVIAIAVGAYVAVNRPKKAPAPAPGTTTAAAPVATGTARPAATPAPAARMMRREVPWAGDGSLHRMFSL